MSLVEYAVEGAVALITLDRPPVNALNGELIADIDHALSAAENPAIRAVVIAGKKHFAAGADIKRFADALETESPEPQASDLGSLVKRLEDLEKPTIAAISGYALGGGLELAMGADFRYMASDAKVGQPEILLGIIPGAGGTQRLMRLVGFQVAKEMIMSGRQVPAHRSPALCQHQLRDRPRRNRQRERLHPPARTRRAPRDGLGGCRWVGCGPDPRLLGRQEGNGRRPRAHHGHRSPDRAGGV